MSAYHLQHNRPVHLARMFSSYERAMEIVFQPSDGKPSQQRLRETDALVKLLQKALHHAEFSILTGPALTEEKEFMHFIRLNRLSALSIRSMLENELELSEHEGFIAEFLGGSGEACSINALQYQRRSLDVMEGLAVMMRQAQSAYFSLKKKVYDGMIPEDQERYNRSYAEFDQELHPQLDHLTMTPAG